MKVHHLQTHKSKSPQVINSRNKVYSTINTEMLNLYWNIGKMIMEIQQGDERTNYGDAQLDKLS